MSRSGYYAWWCRKDHPSQRQLARARFDQLVAEAFAARKGRSGAMGLTLGFDELGHSYNRKTVAASMKGQGLFAKAVKKYKATTDLNRNLPVAPSHLGQDCSAEAPIRSGSATSSISGPARVYLAVVLDLFSCIGGLGHGPTHEGGAGL